MPLPRNSPLAAADTSGVYTYGIYALLRQHASFSPPLPTGLGQGLQLLPLAHLLGANIEPEI